MRVEVNGEFNTEGAGASNITYNASVHAKTSQKAILELMNHTDKVAEIQNTLRNSAQVTLANCEAREVGLVSSASGGTAETL